MSGFLLDTNVISELIKPRPEPKVTVWIDATDEELLFLSVLTLGEIRKGVVLLPRSTRRIALEAWLSKELPLRFSDRIKRRPTGCGSLGASFRFDRSQRRASECDRRIVGCNRHST